MVQEKRELRLFLTSRESNIESNFRNGTNYFIG